MKSSLITLIKKVFGSTSVKDEECLVHCPYCHHRKKKMSINLVSFAWKCWVCNKKGRNLTTLFYKGQATDDVLSKLKSLIKENGGSSKTVKVVKDHVRLPVEFRPLYTGDYRDPEFRNAIKYLKKRGVTKYDILRYNIGYCESGPYRGMVIIPSYDEDGQLNFYVGRSYYDSGFKHKLPKASKDIVGFDLLVNWNEPINIVEGVFDAISVGDNSIPLFGKQLPNQLKLKIAQSGVKRVNLLLDGDAMKDALRHAEYFMGNGIEVHLIEMGESDPSELGPEKVREMIKDSDELEFYRIMQLKLGFN